MGIDIVSGDRATFLYCSTSMRPINTESFDDYEAADSFLTFASARVRDVRACSALDLDALRADWQKLPVCVQCGERVLHPGERPDECEDCKPECEWVRRGSRGTEDCSARGGEVVDVERNGSTYREGTARAVREERV